MKTLKSEKESREEKEVETEVRIRKRDIVEIYNYATKV